MIYKRQKKSVIVSILLLISFTFLAGCGYRPSATYAQMQTGDSVSVHIVISAVNPQNTVLIKDAVSKAVIENFRTRLTSSANAATKLTVNLASVSYYPIQYNSNGYIISYRMRTVLLITMLHDGVTKKYTEQGIYDFSIEPNAIISNSLRITAIKNSATKAIRAFVAQISAIGARGKRK